MLSHIKNAIRGLFQKPQTKETALSLYAMIGKGTVNRGINIRLDNPVGGRQYLTIGENCIISGHFIFESTKGMIIIGNHSYIGGGDFYKS